MRGGGSCGCLGCGAHAGWDVAAAAQGSGAGGCGLRQRAVQRAPTHAASTKAGHGSQPSSWHTVTCATAIEASVLVMAAFERRTRCSCGARARTGVRSRALRLRCLPQRQACNLGSLGTASRPWTGGPRGDAAERPFKPLAVCACAALRQMMTDLLYLISGSGGQGRGWWPRAAAPLARPALVRESRAGVGPL